MEQKYNDKMDNVGYSQLVCDIFLNWEDVKDEILLSERKVGSGNGTVHIFLGAADANLRKEFSNYYTAVENGEDTITHAVKVKHFFLKSNILSMLGYVCQYYNNKGQEYQNIISNILQQLNSTSIQNGLISTESLFKLSTGSKKLRPYFKQFDENGIFHKIIRKLLLPNSAYKISLYKNENNEYAAFWLIGFDDLNDFEVDSTKSYVLPDNLEHKIESLQNIYYGAPGTGKSNKINKETKGEEVIRITFHPDTDYSTFVGAYKPTTDLLPICNELGEPMKIANQALYKEQIVYEFVPQSFLLAYIAAWKNYADADVNNIKKQYLVIEEINRGNCAQIFGDLFQLLDRNDEGFSEYPINADSDMKKQLNKAFQGLEIPQKNSINAMFEGRDVVKGVLDGDLLLLPNNLYIWATMNTSDQSLFPIDSAFKRRWDWEYMPIEKGDRDFIIEIGSKKYDWWNFISIINSKIDEITGSEDKKLGYWFAKPAGNDTIINCNQFVSKVLFYLWNDVYKDYADDNRSIFRITEGNNSKKVAFTDFFGSGREMKLYAFMQANGVDPISSISVNSQDENFVDDEADIPQSQRDYSKYSINGDGAYGKGELVRRVIELYCEQQSNSSAYEIQAFWMGLNTGIVHLVETQSEFDIRTKNSTDVNKRAKELKLKNGEIIYVSTQVGSGNIMTFINAVNAADIGFSIAKV